MESELRVFSSSSRPPLRIATTSAWTRFALTVILLFAIVTTNESVGATETYSGLLVPDALSPAIPIIVDLEQARSRFSGHVTTSPPLTGKGRIIAGERQRSVCNFKSDIGAGRTIAFEGYCLSKTIEGVYTVIFPDGSSRRGTYRLLRAESEASAMKKRTESSDPPVRSTTICLSANSACLAACPREDYNAEFVCSNRCRQRLAACKGKAAGTLASPAAAPVPLGN